MFCLLCAPPTCAQPCLTPHHHTHAPLHTLTTEHAPLNRCYTQPPLKYRHWLIDIQATIAIRKMGIPSTTTAIVGLTGVSDKADLVTFRDCGLNAVFPKPLNPTVFNEIVKRYLGSFLDQIAADKKTTAANAEVGADVHLLSPASPQTYTGSREQLRAGAEAAAVAPTLSLQRAPGAYTAAIAIVDDSKMVQLMLLKRLHALGLSAVVCDNGRELLDRVERGELFQVRSHLPLLHFVRIILTILT